MICIGLPLTVMRISSRRRAWSTTQRPVVPSRAFKARAQFAAQSSATRYSTSIPLAGVRVHLSGGSPSRAEQGEPSIPRQSYEISFADSVSYLRSLGIENASLNVLSRPKTIVSPRHELERISEYLIESYAFPREKLGKLFSLKESALAFSSLASVESIMRCLERMGLSQSQCLQVLTLQSGSEFLLLLSGNIETIESNAKFLKSELRLSTEQLAVIVAQKPIVLRAEEKTFWERVYTLKAVFYGVYLRRIRESLTAHPEILRVTSANVRDNFTFLCEHLWDSDKLAARESLVSHFSLLVMNPTVLAAGFQCRIVSQGTADAKAELREHPSRLLLSMGDGRRRDEVRDVLNELWFDADDILSKEPSGYRCVASMRAGTADAKAELREHPSRLLLSMGDGRRRDEVRDVLDELWFDADDILSKVRFGAQIALCVKLKGPSGYRCLVSMRLDTVSQRVTDAKSDLLDHPWRLLLNMGDTRKHFLLSKMPYLITSNPESIKQTYEWLCHMFGDGFVRDHPELLRFNRDTKLSPTLSALQDLGFVTQDVANNHRLLNYSTTKALEPLRDILKHHSLAESLTSENIARILHCFSSYSLGELLQRVRQAERLISSVGDSSKDVSRVLKKEEPELYSELRSDRATLLLASRKNVNLVPRVLLSSNTRVAAEFHPTKNQHPRLPRRATADDYTLRSRARVWWKCAFRGHEWQAYIGNRTRDESPLNCPQCVHPNHTLAKTCPEIAREWHVEKNGKLTPLDVRKSYGTPVWWRCDKVWEHEWEATPKSRTRPGRGLFARCPHCFPVIFHGASLEGKHPDVAREWHPTKNGKLTARTVVATSKYRVWWQCVNDSSHEWEASVRARVGDRMAATAGCPRCWLKENSLEKKFPDVAKQWSYVRNDAAIMPESVGHNAADLVWWECMAHGERAHIWQARVVDRTSGTVADRQSAGCRLCTEQKARRQRLDFPMPLKRSTVESELLQLHSND